MTDAPSPQNLGALSGAILDAVGALLDREAAHGDADPDGLPPAVTTAMHLIRRLGIEYVRRYHRLELHADAPFPDEPTLIVANHGFGGIFDLNVLALLSTFDALQLDRPVTILTHQIAWTLRVGPLIEALGARPAGRDTALRELAVGHHVLVLPGGDIDAFKAWPDRNRIVMAGRTGFARLAIDAGVPIVPIVTAGAGNSILVLSDGQRLARAMQLDKLLRLKALPVSVSLPWGFNVGAVGLLPYLPLPAKLTTSVLPAIPVAGDDDATSVATRVAQTMQEALLALTTR